MKVCKKARLLRHLQEIDSGHQQCCAYRGERISSSALSWIGDEACCSRFLGPISCPSCNIMHNSHLCNGLESWTLFIEVLTIACLPTRQAMGFHGLQACSRP